jgi:hypothetical protein
MLRRADYLPGGNFDVSNASLVRRPTDPTLESPSPRPPPRRPSLEVDLVLLDLKLPKMTGLELLEWMKGEASLKEIPVFILPPGHMKPKIRERRGTLIGHCDGIGDGIAHVNGVGVVDGLQERRGAPLECHPGCRLGRLGARLGGPDASLTGAWMVLRPPAPGSRFPRGRAPLPAPSLRLPSRSAGGTPPGSGRGAS